MKKHIKTISIAAVIVVALVTVVLAKANSLFSVSCTTTKTVGYVHVHCSDNSTTHIDVTGEGMFYGDISATPSFVVINSYVTNEGSKGWAINSNGDTLSVDFSNAGFIVVGDTQENN
jgi:hypothetical protein